MGIVSTLASFGCCTLAIFGLCTMISGFPAMTIDSDNGELDWSAAYEVLTQRVAPILCMIAGALVLVVFVYMLWLVHGPSPTARARDDSTREQAVDEMREKC